jgi:REP element-mobilizing transposase RayT
MDKYQNRYRIPSTRLQNWDYGWDAPYFVTICTENRKCYFGAIVQDKMQLSRLGNLAEDFWYEIKRHAPDVELGPFVVMPNHIHGILTLNGNGDDTDNAVETRHARQKQDTHPVETRHALSQRRNALSQRRHALSLQLPRQAIGRNRFQNQGANTLSSIIGSYKSAVTRQARRLGHDFSWQSRFYDHVIRNADSYYKIQNYIQNNPINWKADALYEERINA